MWAIDRSAEKCFPTDRKASNHAVEGADLEKTLTLLGRAVSSLAGSEFGRFLDRGIVMYHR